MDRHRNDSHDVHRSTSLRWTPFLRSVSDMFDDVAESGSTQTATDLNSSDSAGETALIRAIQSKSTASVQLLLDSGADPNASNSAGKVPLLQCFELGDTALTKLLLDRGADPNTESCGDKLLVHLIRNRNTAVAKLLLEKGADPNIRTSKGETALVYAIRSENTALAQILLDHGADPNAMSRFIHYPSSPELIHCTRSSSFDIGSSSFDRNSPWWQHIPCFFDHANEKWSPLHEAAWSNDLAVMQRLICLRADIYVTDQFERTTLMIAAWTNFRNGVKLLLQAAGNEAANFANRTTRLGENSVWFAASRGYADILQLLLEHGADCNPQQPVNLEHRRMHPLVQAIGWNHHECVKVILPHINKETLREMSIDPVMLAVKTRFQQSLCLLLDAGYSSEIPTNHEGGIYYRFSTSTGFSNKLFHRYYCTPLGRAVEWGWLWGIERLIKAGAKMVYTANKQSPFLQAMFAKQDVLDIFLENDVDINVVSRNSGFNVPDALLCALEIGCPEKILLLLRCGMDPALKYWCRCQNSHSLMFKVIETSRYAHKLIKLLVSFSPGIPSCCDEVASVIGAEPEVPKLQHLSRLAIRRAIPTSQLLHDRFRTSLRIPKILADYIAFKAVLHSKSVRFSDDS